MSDSCTCACASAPRRRRPTAAVVIASLALFMSLGGTSYAAVKAKSIGSKQLKSNAVSTTKIARNGVTASDIRAAAIDGSKIRAGSVGSQHVVAGSIGSQHILDGSVTGQDVQDSTLTGADIADNSITTGDIANNDILLEDLNPDALTGLIDLPTQLFTNDYVGDPQSLPIDTGYADFLNWSTPNPRAGVSLLLAQVNVGSVDGTDVTCRLTNQGAILTQASATIAAGQRETINLTTVADLQANDALRVQCLRTTHAAVVDLSDTGGTALTVIRVAR